MFAIKVTVAPVKGKDIKEVCGDVKELSEFLECDLTFQFNGVEITTANRSINEMVESYVKAR